MSLIPFPNIPNLPGVPALLRSATVPTADSLVNNAISAVVELLFGKETWGVYDQNNTLTLEPDTFLGIEYKNNFRISNYIQEEGAFASYNKVGTPYECQVRMAIGADKAARTSFLEQIDVMLKNIDTYSIITPEVTYIEATLQAYHYVRKSTNGARLIEVDLRFMEVRKNPAVESEQPQEPQSVDPVSQGQVQLYNPKTGLDLPVIQ